MNYGIFQNEPNVVSSKKRICMQHLVMRTRGWRRWLDSLGNNEKMYGRPRRIGIFWVPHSMPMRKLGYCVLKKYETLLFIQCKSTDSGFMIFYEYNKGDAQTKAVEWLNEHYHSKELTAWATILYHGEDNSQCYMRHALIYKKTKRCDLLKEAEDNRVEEEEKLVLSEIIG